MRKEIRVVDHTKGIVQVTLPDERWYAQPYEDPNTGLPSYKYVPSITWITSFYPKGIGYLKHVANLGYDEAQAYMRQRGDSGTRVHLGSNDLLTGNEVTIESKYPASDNDSTLTTLTAEEYSAVLTLKKWWDTVEEKTGFKPRVKDTEFVVFNNEFNYAGTIDIWCEIFNPKTQEWESWIIDLKTSKDIYPSHEIQVSAYKHASPHLADSRLAILQLGYSRNKAGYKFTEITDQFDLFLATKQIWAKEASSAKPSQKDLPLRISLDGADKPIEPVEANSGNKGANKEAVNGTSDRRREQNGLRESNGGRVVNGHH